MLDDEKLKEVVQNTANLPDGLKFIEYLIDISGCYTQGLAKDNMNEVYNKGFRDFGLKIRQLLLDYCPEMYIKIIKDKEQKQ